MCQIKRPITEACWNTSSVHFSSVWDMVVCYYKKGKSDNQKFDKQGMYLVKDIELDAGVISESTGNFHIFPIYGLSSPIRSGVSPGLKLR